MDLAKQDTGDVHSSCEGLRAEARQAYQEQDHDCDCDECGEVVSHSSIVGQPKASESEAVNHFRKLTTVVNVDSCEILDLSELDETWEPAVAVDPPAEGLLPPGPLRDLVLELHELYRAAGKPGIRKVSQAIRLDVTSSFSDTVSHATISAILAGRGLAKWVKVECVVRQLARWAVTQPNEEATVRRFHGLWLSASDATQATPASVVQQENPSAKRTADGWGLEGSAADDTELAIGNLPYRNNTFTGRGMVISEIDRLLAIHAQTVVHGLGGVGKSQLAVEYAYRHATNYEVVWWVPAEDASLARSALAALGEHLQLPTRGSLQRKVQSVSDTLETGKLKWLLLFDNADDNEETTRLLPRFGGKVIITTRNSAWAGSLRSAVRLNEFNRAESVEFIRGRRNSISVSDADLIAGKLGDLPLALDQFVTMQAATQMSIAEYVHLFDEHLNELLKQGATRSQPTTVSRVFEVAFDRLRAGSEVAAQLLGLFGHLGSEPTPLSLLRNGRDGPITAPLNRALREPAYMDSTLKELRRYGLAMVDTDARTIRVHSLVQVWLREGVDENLRRMSRKNVQGILAAANPGRPDDIRTWALHSRIGPHVRRADLLGREGPATTAARAVVLDQARYLYVIGDYAGSRDLAQEMVLAWARSAEAGGIGRSHEYTLLAQRHLANALRYLGEYRKAHDLSDQTLGQLRESPAFGDDHALTIAVGFGLGFDLRLAGNVRLALQRDRENLKRAHRVFGGADASTLTARNNVTANLRLLGDFTSAYDIDLELVDQWSRLEGPDHPKTCWALGNVARDLYGLGRYQEALATISDKALPAAVARLGEHHHEVLVAFRTMVVSLRQVGRLSEATEEARRNHDAFLHHLGPDHEHTLSSAMTHANVLHAVGRRTGSNRDIGVADDLALETVHSYRRVLGIQHPITLAAEVNHASISRTAGRTQESRDTVQTTLDELTRSLGRSHPYSLCAAINLANCHAQDRDYDAAKRLSREVFTVSREIRGPDHPDTIAAGINMALNMRLTGERPEADSLLRTFGTSAAGLHLEFDFSQLGLTEARIDADIEPPPM